MSLLNHTIRHSWTFRTLCIALGAISGFGGEWIARELVLGERLAGVEALRSDGGQYIVNDILTMGYRPEAVTSVIYGDSANDSVPERDRDKRFITQMIRDELASSEVSVLGLSFPGNSVDWMSSQLRYLATRYRDLDYVVIPLNVRWVSPGWRGRRNTTGARKAYELYAAGPFRWALEIELAYESPRQRFQTNRDMVDTVMGSVDMSHALLGTEDYIERFGGDRDEVRAYIGTLRMALSYGVDLPDGDPFFTEVDRIAEICRTEEIACLFYLPPFNLGLAQQLFPAVADMLQINLRKVRSFVERRSYSLLDLSTHLEPSNFHDDYNEHVDEVGRRLIAGCIARAIEALHGQNGIEGRLLGCNPAQDSGFAIVDLKASGRIRD